MALQMLNIIIIITAVLVGVRVSGTRMLGGLSEEKPPNAEVQALIDNVRPMVEERLGHRVSRFILLVYKTQVVAGINYFAKVDIGEESVAHLKIYRALDQRLSLSDLQYPKDRDHLITYF